MKVLFLDVDGVMNCSTTRQRHGSFIGIDPTKAAMVRFIVQDTGCEVVLSSAWRLDPESRDEVRRNGIDFMDVTKSLSPFRGNEIREWLNRHPVERYAILDDDPDFYPDQPLFKTSFNNGGLNDMIAARVIDYLNGEDYVPTE